MHCERRKSVEEECEGHVVERCLEVCCILHSSRFLLASVRLLLSTVGTAR